MSQFNPENERLKSQYFLYEREANGKSKKTIEHMAQGITRFEEFTNYQSFKNFNRMVALTCKDRLLKQKNRCGEPLNVSTVGHTLEAWKAFFKWLALQPGYKSRIKIEDIAYLTLQEKERRSLQPGKVKDYPTIEQISKVVDAMPATTIVEKRNRAIMALVITTGVRDGALITLKLKHIKPQRKFVIQDPKEVNTKFSKIINTYFFPVGDKFHAIIEEWVECLRAEQLFSDADPLFPKEKLTHDADMSFQGGTLSREHWASASTVRGIFKQAFEGAGDAIL